MDISPQIEPVWPRQPLDRFPAAQAGFSHLFTKDGECFIVFIIPLTA